MCCARSSADAHVGHGQIRWDAGDQQPFAVSASAPLPEEQRREQQLREHGDALGHGVGRQGMHDALSG
jgi:hypothetical protein